MKVEEVRRITFACFASPIGAHSMGVGSTGEKERPNKTDQFLTNDCSHWPKNFETCKNLKQLGNEKKSNGGNVGDLRVRVYIATLLIWLRFYMLVVLP